MASRPLSSAGSATPRGRWSTPWWDPCAQPGGCVLCIYATACPCCAAGDIALAASRGDARIPGACYAPNPCCSTFLPCGVCCCWPCDRKAIADKYAIADGCLAHPVARHVAFVANCAFLVPCLLIQECVWAVGGGAGRVSLLRRRRLTFTLRRIPIHPSDQIKSHKERRAHTTNSAPRRTTHSSEHGLIIDV